MTPWPPRTTASAAVAALIVIALAGCGGGTGSTDSEPGVGSDFAAKARSACDAALKDKQTWTAFPVPDFNPTDPEPSAFPKVATWLEHEVAPTFKTWHDSLVALGDPPTDQQAWKDVIAAIATIEQGNKNQISAANANDPDAFKAATQTMKDAQTDLVAATDDAGVPTCAEVHAS